MTRIATITALSALFALASCPIKAAEQCPEGTPSCKVVTITPQEEQTLNDAIFPNAIWANRTLTELVEQWKKKIAASPAGEVKAAPQAPPKK